MHPSLTIPAAERPMVETVVDAVDVSDEVAEAVR